MKDLDLSGVDEILAKDTPKNLETKQELDLSGVDELLSGSNKQEPILSDLPIDASTVPELISATPSSVKGGLLGAGAGYLAQKGIGAAGEGLEDVAANLATRAIGLNKSLPGKDVIRQSLQADAPFISDKDIGKYALENKLLGPGGFGGTAGTFGRTQGKLTSSLSDIEKLLEETRLAKQAKNIPETNLMSILEELKSGISKEDQTTRLTEQKAKYAKEELKRAKKSVVPVGEPSLSVPKQDLDLEDLIASSDVPASKPYVPKTPMELELQKRSIPFQEFTDTEGTKAAQQTHKKLLKEAVEADVSKGLGEKGLAAFQAAKKEAGMSGIISASLLDKATREASKSPLGLSDIAATTAASMVAGGPAGVATGLAKKGLEAKGAGAFAALAHTGSKALKGISKVLPGPTGAIVGGLIGGTIGGISSAAAGENPLVGAGKGFASGLDVSGSEEVGKGSDFTPEQLKERFNKSIQEKAKEFKGTPQGNALNNISMETRQPVKEMLLKNLQTQYPEISLPDVKMKDDARRPKMSNDEDIIAHLAKSEGNATNAASGNVIMPGVTGIYDDGKGNPTTMYGANLRSPTTQKAYKDLGIDPYTANEEQHRQAAIYNWNLHGRYTDQALKNQGLDLSKTDPEKADTALFLLRDMGYRGGTKTFSAPNVDSMVSKLNSGDMRGFANEYIKSNHFRTGGGPRQQELVKKLKDLVANSKDSGVYKP